MERNPPGRPRAWLVNACLEQHPSRRHDFLLQTLCQEVASFLGLENHAVDPSAGFVALGFDSLRAVEFRGILEESLDIELRSTLLFDQPDCERMAQFLLTHLPTEEAVAEPAMPSRRDPTNSGPIAVVGVGCRMPGVASDPRSFWDLLAAGGSAISEPPEGRWPIEELYDPDPAVPGRIYTRRGGFLPAIERFDANFFGIPPVEATMLDPQQRLLLEVAWEALEDAAIAPDRLHDLTPGVFVGMRASEYFQSQCARLPEDADAYYATGNAVSTAAGRLSYFLGFRGPSFALDTACSGSLVAVHQAIQSLRSGECRAALAGGVNTLVDPLSSVGLCRARMLSPEGLCKSFDARADGYVRAEGCGLLLLMSVDDARAMGLPIKAIIRGSAINQDGRTSGLTVPHGPSQEAVIRSALIDAGLQADDIDYLEAHGTGTTLGDPIEIAALDSVFAGRRERGRRLLLGSVKTNVGHLEAAAGISGLIKVILSLENEMVPRHCNFEEPNPHIDWDHTEIELAIEARKWPRGERRRYAGVSSFGFSGTNAHVVVEEGDGPAPRAATRQHHAVVLSATTESALRQQALNWADRVAAHPSVPLADVAFTAGHGRKHFPQRLGLVAGDSEELASILRGYADGARTGVTTGEAARTAPRIAFLFSGQGAQRPGAGRELYDEEPVFQAALDRCARVFDRLRDRPLTEVLFGDEPALLRRTDYTQPAMFALQYALCELWRSFGVEPSLVLGHSVGEISAATAAGILSPEDGLRLCAARGTLMVQHCVEGAMLAVFAKADRALQLTGPLPANCALAAVNGPEEIVISGDVEAIHALARRLDSSGVRSQLLSVSHAFHSPLMQPMLPAFERRLQQLEPNPARVPLYPCREPGVDSDPSRPEHWAEHVVAPVAFCDALTAAARDADVLIEIGPSPVLLGLAARSLPRPLPAIPSLRVGQSERGQILRGVVQCHVQGTPIDFAALTRADEARRLSLPTYPFERQRFWLRNEAAPIRGAVHPLLGTRRPSVALGPGQTLFEGTLAERSPTWLADHRVYDRALFPAAGLVECALAAAAHSLSSQHIELRDLAIAAPLWLDAVPTTTQLLVDGAGPTASFRLCRQDGDNWPVILTGSVHSVDLPALPEPVVDAAAGGKPVAVAAFYEAYLAAGLVYGPAFQGVTSVRHRPLAASGDFALPEDQRSDAGPFLLHPAVLDACFQIAGLATTEQLGEDTWLPVGIESVRVFQVGILEGSCRATCRPPTNDRTRVVDLVILDDKGQPAVQVAGLQLVRAEAQVANAVDPGRWLHNLHWQRRPRVETVAATGSWVATGLQTTDKTRLLAGQLTAAGLPTRTVALDALTDEAEEVRGIVFDATNPVADSAHSIGELLNAVKRCAEFAATATPPARLCLLTSDAVAADVLDCQTSPAGAAAWGFLRSLSLEHPELRPLCIDVDARTGWDLLAQEVLADDAEGMVAFRHEQRLVARLLAGDRPPDQIAIPPGNFRLRSLEYGRLEQLAAVPIEAVAPVGDEVVIEVAAAGLNFKDVLYAMGLLREWSEAEGIHEARDQSLGFECSGRVVAVGPEVRQLSVGDEVVAAANDALSNRVVVSERRCFAVPGGVNLCAAAGMPTIFATAVHGLEELARLKPSDKVLIHAAAGGVGLAALQICRRIGCEVFATSSPAKADFLRSLGVRHWADSRSHNFAEAIRHASGDGVDVVLNSLTGDAIARSVGLLRRGGRFVEIGKRGIWSPERMAARRPDVQYFTFDLAEEVARDPELLPRLLRKVQQGLEDASLRPVQTTAVALQRAPQLFAAMAKGRHIGKLVLVMPRTISIREDRTYLLTGGTGGLGRSIAKELISRGAKHLALLARTPVDDASLADLREAASVRVVTADLGDSQQVAAAIREVHQEMPKIAGVVHAAGVLRDTLLRDLEQDDIEQVLQPKIDGARYLASLLDDVDLDFLVSLSSLAAWTGNQSQTAYGAANAWLEAWSGQRQAKARPAQAIAFGPWGEVGMAARMPAARRTRLRELGLDAIPPTVGAAFLVDSLGLTGPVPGVFAIRWPAFLRQYAGSTPPLLQTLPTTDDGSQRRESPVRADGSDKEPPGSLRETLLPLSTTERHSQLRSYIQRQFAQVLGFAQPDDIQPQRTFVELGIDSLMAVEIRTRLGVALGLPLPATLLFDHADVEQLAQHLLSLLPAGTGTAEADSDEKPTIVPRPDGADDADLERALEEQVRLMEDRQ
ncbi:MAG: SDR family NAD(P)-dependent oxidoreductase [Planctomycetota bacterium]|nr:SDR family NAD(P)-dependent oxidoreductase [Planctomycetota bacterium]